MSATNQRQPNQTTTNQSTTNQSQPTSPRAGTGDADCVEPAENSTEIRPEDLLPGGPRATLANLSYEQARAALEEVVSALEATSVSLEDSLMLWERGNQLADIAQAHLNGARDRIAALRPDLLADNA